MFAAERRAARASRTAVSLRQELMPDDSINSRATIGMYGRTRFMLTMFSVQSYGILWENANERLFFCDIM